MSIREINLTMTGKAISQAQTWSYPKDDGNIYIIPTYELIVEGTDEAGNKQKKLFEAFRFGVHRPTTTSSAKVVGLSDQQTHKIKSWIPNYTVHSANSPEIGAWQVVGNFLIHDGPDKPKTELYASIGCIEICQGPYGFVIFNNFIIGLSGSKKSSRAAQLAEIGSSGKMVITYLKAPYPPLKKK